MQNIDIYVGEDEERRKRRRGKWLIPIFVGIGAALALGREKPPALVVPRPVVPTATVVTETTSTIDTTTATASTPTPGHIAVTPTLLDFGDGPMTRGVPAQMAMIRNDGSQALARVSAVAGGPFMATNGCTEELAPGDRCMIAVVFTPRHPGQFPGSLKITAGLERVQIPLHGGVPAPHEVSAPPRPSPPPAPVPVATQLTPPPAPTPPPQPPPARVLCFEPAQLHFTSIGRQTITLTNPEPEPLRVIDVVPVGLQGQTVSGYVIESKRCLRVLKAGEQCRFTILASELAVMAHEAMKLTVYYEDPATGNRRAARFGTGCGGR